MNRLFCNYYKPTKLLKKPVNKLEATWTKCAFAEHRACSQVYPEFGQ